ncbi:ABC transporter permease [Rhodoligotrophos ferricapiens]|uniref:ABC transporter permease n=1 Tax=Rhodoligotrophos ferricapiens TaxID=3069264 RepID=UPI00315C50EF
MSSHQFWQQFRYALQLGFAWMILGFLVLPMLIILPVSLTDRSYLSLPEHSLSIQHYQAFFSNSAWLSATGQSLLIASIATILALIIGSLCAIGCWRLSNGFSNGVRLFMLAPIIVPTIVQGLAYYRFWAATGLFDTYIGVIIAHTLVGLPYTIITVSASLAGFDVKLEQAARSLGASTWRTLLHVIVPGISPGLFAGGLFAFTHSFDELVIVLFITSRGIATLPKRIWEGIEDNIDPTIAAAAVLLITITFAVLLLGALFRSLSERASARRNQLAEEH